MPRFCVFCLAMFCLIPAVRADELEDMAIKLAEKLGGSASIDTNLDEIARVSVKLNTPTDADIQKIVKIPVVGSIQVADGSKLTEIGFTALKELPDLQVLTLAKCPINEKSAAAIGSIRTLNDLFLGGNKLTDASFAPMKKLVNIKRLDIFEAGITDKSIPVLLAMKKLEYLNLSGTKIGDPGVIQLKELMNLKTVMLVRTNATAKGISALEDARGKELTVRY